jgi:predicted enzyme related to lactoylglutathione lyase
MEETMANPFVHVELNTRDLPKAKAFYGMPGAPSMWLAYVLVDDIDAATAKARSLGAQIVKEVTEIPNVGRFSIFIDPTGAMLALFKPKGM